MNLTKKPVLPVALVTGSARRIGAEIVRALHQAGYCVVIHCHQSILDANQLAASLNALRPDSALVVEADLSDQVAVDEIINATVAWRGSLSVLVNNASVFTVTDLQTLNTDGYQMLFAVNVFAPWRLSLQARPWLEKMHGSIINITDIHAEKPLKHYAEYCQTKAALWMQTKTLAREFAPHIRVNAVAPGAIIWPEETNALSQAMQDRIIANTPLKRHGEPKQIAEAVLALLTNSFMTGQVLRVDGGRSIV